MRQQRTSALRRTKPNFLGVQYTTIDWIFNGIVGDEVFWQLVGPGHIDLLTHDGINLTGVPRIVGLVPTLTPVAARLDNGNLVIRYDVTPTTPLFAYLESNDPALRGRNGEYLTGKQLTYVDPVAPPSDITFFGGTATGFDIDIICNVADPTLAVRDTSCLTYVPTGEHPIAVRVAGGHVITTWVTAPAPGQFLDIVGGSSNWMNSSGGSAVSTSFALT